MKIIIIAGPNGAGKTTFATEFLPREGCCPEFVNADLIAAGLSPFQPERVALAAGRVMIDRIAVLANAGKSFAFETTLATRVYLRHIPRWRAKGYRVKLHFLKLPDPEFAIDRVEQRVRLGGHAIPPQTIRRRFARGLENLHDYYLKAVDEWSIYDGSQNPPRRIETNAHQPPETLMEDPTEYRTPPPAPTPPTPLNPLEDAEASGALAALARGAAKAVARARAAGLEPVVRTCPPPKNEPSSPGG